MATPPPLPPPENRQTDINASGPRQLPSIPAQDAGSGQPQPGGGTNPWFIVGGVLIGLMVITAVLLFCLTDLFSDKDYRYDDGNPHDKVLRQQEETEDPRVDVLRRDSVAETPVVSGPSSLHGLGTNGRGAMAVDLNINPDGTLSGTYWNILYNLEFSVSGNRLSDGTLDMTLTNVKDKTPTHITLRSSDGVNYSGQWGKKEQMVNISLTEDIPYSGINQSVKYGNHLKGPGDSSVLNADFNIGEGSDGNLYFWYPGQGYKNRLRVIDYGDFMEIYNNNGGVLATISWDYPGESGTLRDTDGQSFAIY